MNRFIVKELLVKNYQNLEKYKEISCKKRNPDNNQEENNLTLNITYYTAFKNSKTI